MILAWIHLRDLLLRLRCGRGGGRYGLAREVRGAFAGRDGLEREAEHVVLREVCEGAYAVSARALRLIERAVGRGHKKLARASVQGERRDAERRCDGADAGDFRALDA